MKTMIHPHPYLPSIPLNAVLNLHPQTNSNNNLHQIISPRAQLQLRDQFHCQTSSPDAA